MTACVNSNTMLIFVDYRAPAQVLDRLSDYGRVIPFRTEGITYDSISGHPDVFMCSVGDDLVLAPNIPEAYITLLKEENIPFRIGEHPVGAVYPWTASYNASVGAGMLIHRSKLSDPGIIELASGMEFIDVQQGYSRCSCLILPCGHVITSDQGIAKALDLRGISHTHVDPVDIILPGQVHGFIGGCMGIIKDKLMVMGSLSALVNADELYTRISESGLEVVELYEGPLFDGGGIQIP